MGLRDGRSLVELGKVLETRGAEVSVVRPLRVLTVSALDRRTVLRTLRDRAALVEYVEPLLVRRLHAEPAAAIDPMTGRSYDWAIKAVRAPEMVAAAGGVPVAVVDSGVDAAHPDLVGRVTTGVDVLGTTSVDDLVGHGTFVAGLISATDGNGAGGSGVAGPTPIIPVRVSTSPEVTSANLAAGIVAAVDAGASVVNVSIGGPTLSQVEQAALDYARSRDVLVVASAGNSGEDGNWVEYPAAAIGGDSGGWSHGLSVAATDPAGMAASFSTHNRHVSIAAPGAGSGSCGDGVFSTVPTLSTSIWSGPGCYTLFEDGLLGAGRYGYGEGTSFSAPLVAGAAALVRRGTPELRADQVADVLKRSANRGNGLAWNEFTGAGVLDVSAAVTLADSYDITPPELTLSPEEGRGRVRLVASAEDRTSHGRELIGGATLAIDYSRDGSLFLPLRAADPSSIDATYSVSTSEPLWFRAAACDRNRNCSVRVTGPHQGEGANGPAPSSPSARLGRSRILAFGMARSCGRRSRCLRIRWKSSLKPARPAIYTAVVREPRRRGILARARGRTTTGRARAINLRLRRTPRCGHVVLRLRVRAGGRTEVLTRRAPVRTRCIGRRGRR